MAVQKQHGFPDLLRCLLRLRESAPGAWPRSCPRTPVRRASSRSPQDLGTEPPDQLLGEGAPSDPLKLNVGQFRWKRFTKQVFSEVVRLPHEHKHVRRRAYAEGGG